MSLLDWGRNEVHKKEQNGKYWLYLQWVEKQYIPKSVMKGEKRVWIVVEIFASSCYVN